MLKSISKKAWIVIAVVAIALIGFFGYRYWDAKRTAVPPGIAWGNGRMQATLADVAAKEPLRVKEILVREGDVVQPGQVLVRLDTVTLESQLAEANAGVALAEQKLAIAKSAIARRQSEIRLAKIEVERSRKLVAERAGSQREYDVRQSTLESTTASLAEEQAKLETAKKDVLVAQANVQTVQTRIDDATLKAPMVGRVLYRLAEPGEVLAAGGKALTIVDLSDVYMEIFLTATDAAQVKMGAEGRITVDHLPGVVAPANVSFVSPEAQFTPKQVETRSEREKLMFRVKLKLPQSLVSNYIDSIKTGVRGVGYVKASSDAVWPTWLEEGLLRAEAPSNGQPSPAEQTAPTVPATPTTPTTPAK
jgi:HlyD family secretion protein